MRLGLPEPLRVDALRVDALRTDAYVESLIAGTSTAPAALEGRAPCVPDRTTTDQADPDGVDREIAAVARLLHATATRPHPSFRFEDRVAARLAAVARGASSAAVVGAGAIVAFPGAAALPADGSHVAGHAARAVVPIAGIASAAVASAALSIGAAAVVAWRRARPRRGLA